MLLQPLPYSISRAYVHTSPVPYSCFLHIIMIDSDQPEQENGSKTRERDKGNLLPFLLAPPSPQHLPPHLPACSIIVSSPSRSPKETIYSIQHVSSLSTPLPLFSLVYPQSTDLPPKSTPPPLSQSSSNPLHPLRNPRSPTPYHLISKPSFFPRSLFRSIHCFRGLWSWRGFVG